MPQMMPMWWVLLYILFMLSFFLLIIMIYFFLLPYLNFKNLNKSMHSNWTWQW